MRPVVVWFRRDLRVDDQAALYHAARTGVPLLPVFIFDSQVVDRLSSDGAAFDLQAEALRDLERAIAALGGKLILLQGRGIDVHRRLIREHQPAALFYNRDYEPMARARDAAVEQLYRHNDIEVQSFRDQVIHEPGELLTGKGEPYVVFTPFANAWKRLSHPVPFGKPRRFSTPKADSVGILGAAQLKRAVLISAPAFRGGRKEAEALWKTFLKNGIEEYEGMRDLPAMAGTSRMSPHLRFGTVSPRVLFEDASERYHAASTAGRRSIAKFVDELIWREFYQAVLFHFPHLAGSNYRKDLDRLPWRRSERLLDLWKEGRTGFPLVDAGMRELRTTGWMHNRVRMVVASFLTKDLFHHWRDGERFFEQYLLDVETASNNGGWQWSASTGVDPKPLRIFNPTLQAEKYDPSGVYIRRHVPELQRVPDKFIHAPHEMPPVLQREVGCIIGRDYPAPIVDHREAAARFKAAYLDLKRSPASRLHLPSRPK